MATQSAEGTGPRKTSSLHSIQSGLLQGLPASTPVAIVQHASLPQQREALTTLDQLADTMLRAHLDQLRKLRVHGDEVHPESAIRPRLRLGRPRAHRVLRHAS